MAAGPAQQSIVESVEDGSGIEGLVGTGANGADQHRNQHRSGDAFAGDVADNDEQRAIPVRDHLEEVAADGTCRMVCGFDREEGRGDGLRE